MKESGQKFSYSVHRAQRLTSLPSDSADQIIGVARGIRYGFIRGLRLIAPFHDCRECKLLVMRCMESVADCTRSLFKAAT